MRNVDNQLPPKNENNPVLILLQKMKLLLYNGGNNPLQQAIQAEQLIALFGGIFSSPATGKVFMYLLINGAATAWTLQVDLRLAEATAYRALKKLRALGLIDAAIRIDRIHDVRGGPRPTVWLLEGADPTTVPLAIQKHNRALSPQYRMAQEIAQGILDMWLIPKGIKSISYKELILDVRKTTDLQGRGLVDATNMVAQALRGMKIKVWR